MEFEQVFEQWTQQQKYILQTCSRCFRKVSSYRYFTLRNSIDYLDIFKILSKKIIQIQIQDTLSCIQIQILYLLPRYRYKIHDTLSCIQIQILYLVSRSRYCILCLETDTRYIILYLDSVSCIQIQILEQVCILLAQSRVKCMYVRNILQKSISFQNKSIHSV